MHLCLQIVSFVLAALVVAAQNDVDLTEKILAKSSVSLEVQRYLDNLLTNEQSDPLPDSVDWRLVSGTVSQVKNQQLCLSSWAFAATGILEGQQLNLTKGQRLVELSEQNLLDCGVNLGGCKGDGTVFGALEFISQQGGIDDEQLYPYKAKSGKCKFQQGKVVMSTKGPMLLPKDEETLKGVVARYGPVGVTIDATRRAFFQYRAGVLKDDTCSNSPDHLWHSMLIVGYGTDRQEGDYWLLKNQWSDVWGEKGYLRMARNRGNMCGIATRAVIASF